MVKNAATCASCLMARIFVLGIDTLPLPHWEERDKSEEGISRSWRKNNGVKIKIRRSGRKG